MVNHEFPVNDLTQKILVFVIYNIKLQFGICLSWRFIYTHRGQVFHRLFRRCVPEWTKPQGEDVPHDVLYIGGVAESRPCHPRPLPYIRS